MNQVGKNKRETVLVGMDGGIESTVAAYLLKKQGMNVIGLGIVFHEYDYESFKVWNPTNLDDIKAMCDQMEIPFYGTNVSSLFYSRLVEPVVSTRLAGEKFEPIIAWNKVLVETLLEKGKKLKVDLIATGHKAKIFKNQKSGIFSLLVPNDITCDETYGLSRLSQEELSKLIFPLAEIKSNEVDKISSLLGLKFSKNDKENKLKRRTFLSSPDFISAVEKFTAPSLRKEGSIINFKDETTLCEHLGVHLYELNQSNIPSKGSSLVDKNLHVVKIFPGKQLVYVDFIDKHFFTHCRLMRFSHDPAMDLSKPLKCFVQLAAAGEKFPCILYFKNNRSVVVEFVEKQDGQCPRGGYQVFYNKKGMGAKVLGSGVVRHAGYFDEGEYRTFPKNRDEEEVIIDESEKKPKINFEF
ncbi:hypothetical protein A9Q84_06075 [Halobacteriovorax marinus]|uniref:tRNA-specific 2-thiouridylase MnmA-like C-terminal domain-containing protein n=1 Tax=Halobacteriovorax marinus TaxID=97084 RepID=A0A1Y5FFY1_9BACT|nr:hypothetical protein A9Q84_06075 [Halobacteriovorax marinus]